MSDFDFKNNVPPQSRQRCRLDEELDTNDDTVPDEILENISSTPIGKLLGKIASLPETRKEKILNVRQQLNQGEYDVTSRLDVALDKVLEELIK